MADITKLVDQLSELTVLEAADHGEVEEIALQRDGTKYIVVQLAPNQAAIRLHLAKALIKAGDKASARKELDALTEASSQSAGKTPADDKGASPAPKSAPAPAGKTPPLTCSPDCAAEVAAHGRRASRHRPRPPGPA